MGSQDQVDKCNGSQDAMASTRRADSIAKRSNDQPQGVAISRKGVLACLSASALKPVSYPSRFLHHEHLTRPRL